MPGPVAVGNGGIQGGKKSAITGILMTSFAAFGTSFSPTLLIVVSTQSLTLVFPSRRVCVLPPISNRLNPDLIVTVFSLDMILV